MIIDLQKIISTQVLLQNMSMLLPRCIICVHMRRLIMQILLLKEVFKNHLEKYSINCCETCCHPYLSALLGALQFPLNLLVRQRALLLPAFLQLGESDRRKWRQLPLTAHVHDVKRHTSGLLRRRLGDETFFSKLLHYHWFLQPCLVLGGAACVQCGTGDAEF